MEKAIIIHGYNDESEFLDTRRPAASNDHWLPWLQRQLLLNKIETQTPEMPGFYKPAYAAWKETFENLKPDENTILVGHSCGGGFLVRWLSENPERHVGKVVLVAPWLDPKKLLGDFFDFEINSDIASKTSSLTVFYSTDDMQEVLSSVELLRDKLIGAIFKEFTGKGHFVLDSMKTEEFPELLSLLIE